MIVADFRNIRLYNCYNNYKIETIEILMIVNNVTFLLTFCMHTRISKKSLHNQSFSVTLHPQQLKRIYGRLSRGKYYFLRLVTECYSKQRDCLLPTNQKTRNLRRLAL